MLLWVSEMDNVYVADFPIENEEIMRVYREVIDKDEKYYKNEIEFESINKRAYIYPFIVGSVKNVEYLAVTPSKDENGIIDASYSYIDRLFILNELNKKDFQPNSIEIEEVDVINKESLLESEKSFLKGINDRMVSGISKRHMLFLKRKGYKLDVAPIKGFDEIKKDYYVEYVYEINTICESKKYQSIYSALKKEFYSFDYQKSEKFIEFLKSYKTPIVYIPRDYRLFYYNIAYEVYLSTTQELRYLSKEELYIKAKNSVSHPNYLKFDDYLKKLIFFFKKKKYIKKLKLDCKSVKEKIFMYYLTLGYDKDSGYKLASYAKANVVKDNYIKLLEISYRLKSKEAQKELFDYYNQPQNFIEWKINKYSSK